MMVVRRLVPLLLLSVLSCGRRADDDGVTSTGTTQPTDGAPWIQDALDCGTPATAGGLAPGDDLQRVNLDPASFPDAVCNDGTPAFFYFRPAANEASRDKWVVQLQGGAGCADEDSCAARWCSVGTAFGMTQMSAEHSPEKGIKADGILSRTGALGQSNPLGDFNHVFVRYCSSDHWVGTAGAIDVDGHHPVTDAPVSYRIAFNGARILDAVLSTLRRDGGEPPAYTLGGGSEALADLDDASTVVLAGASAGGIGTILQADRVYETLRSNNTACNATSCPLQYSAIVDSIFKPEQSALDYSTMTLCSSANLCTYEEAMKAESDSFQKRLTDASCESWHATNAPNEAYKCNDENHVLRHHLAAPFTVRMGLIDSLIAGGFVEYKFSVPGKGLMTLELFGTLVQQQLSALPASKPEEPFARPPAVFGPLCDKHETLSNDEAVYGVTVNADGDPRTFFEIFGNFGSSKTPTSAVYQKGDPVDCK